MGKSTISMAMASSSQTVDVYQRVYCLMFSHDVCSKTLFRRFLLYPEFAWSSRFAQMCLSFRVKRLSLVIPYSGQYINVCMYVGMCDPYMCLCLCVTYRISLVQHHLCAFTDTSTHTHVLVSNYGTLKIQ